MKQRIALFGMVAVALIFAACEGDSGNNGTEVEGGSSSSVVIFSSSSLAISSSNAKVAWSYLNPDISYGEMMDTRDGQVYKTVVIGTQTWMAENLNYKVDSSWCYNNSTDSCSKYGRLYEWASAMAVDAIYNGAILGDSINHQGACPAGWHISTDAEWTILENAVGGEDVAGTALKSTSGWYNDGNGTDAYGFSALPGGNYNGSDFYGVGNFGTWWTATECSSTGAYYRYMYYGSRDVDTDNHSKTYGRSLRCLKD